MRAIYQAALKEIRKRRQECDSTNAWGYWLYEERWVEKRINKARGQHVLLLKERLG